MRTRRDFLKISAAAGGGLLVGFTLPGCDLTADFAGSAPADHALDAFVSVDTDGRATVVIPVPEIGQGVRTSLAMLVAEELEVDWSDVRVTQADAGDEYGPHQRAAGSDSVRAYWDPLRTAGAAARRLLVRAAAQRWNVEPASCAVRNGEIRHAPSGRAIGFGDVAAEAAGLPPDRGPSTADLKRPEDFRIIGTPVRNIDTPEIVRGEVDFGLDIRVPEMVCAAVARCPTYGGTVDGFDPAPALAVPGVHRVVRSPSVGDPEHPYVVEGVAVVADDTWTALRGRDALEVDWNPGPNRDENTRRLHRLGRSGVDRPGEPFVDQGDVEAALAGADRTVEAEYHLPMIAHVPMEPMNCTAHVQENGCEIWAPTQMPAVIRSSVASRLDVPEDAVTVHVSRVGGGFGRRLSSDFVLEAVGIARQLDRPVQVVWSREDDLRHSFYRPFSYHRLTAGIDQGGHLVGWRHRQAGTSRYAFRDDDPARSEFFAGAFPVGIVPHFRQEYTLVESNLNIALIRAPGHNALAFAIQSFVDELAVAAGEDPLAYRLDLLEERQVRPYDEEGEEVYDSDRLRGVLELAGERSGWGSPSTAGRGRGVAAYFTFGTYVAHVVEVSRPGAGEPLRIHRVTSAIDCGQPVNPAGIRAQVEGGVMDGLGAALHGEVTVADGAVQQSNFHDYPILTLDRAPDVEVAIVDSDAPPTGAGEPPYPPVAPALANAVYAATGERHRSLPLDI